MRVDQEAIKAHMAHFAELSEPGRMQTISTTALAPYVGTLAAEYAAAGQIPVSLQELRAHALVQYAADRGLPRPEETGLRVRQGI